MSTDQRNHLPSSEAILAGVLQVPLGHILLALTEAISDEHFDTAYQDFIPKVQKLFDENRVNKITGGFVLAQMLAALLVDGAQRGILQFSTPPSTRKQ